MPEFNRWFVIAVLVFLGGFSAYQGILLNQAHERFQQLLRFAQEQKAELAGYKNAR